jgi:hypothetical protein
MTAPTFRGIFPHNWTAEILPNRPMILPSRHYVYPAQVEEVERGALEVLVQPGGDGLSDTQFQFLATCALGFRDPAVPTGLWSMPDPDWLCAVSGGYAYLIDVAEPERFTHLRFRPVLELLSYDFGACNPEPETAQSEDGATGPQIGPLLLFAGHHSVLAWGCDGEAWESDRLSSEGITNLRIEGTQLHGEGWDLMTDKETPFALDLTTGKRV